MGNTTLLWSFIGALVGSVLTAIILPITINFTIDRVIKTLANASTVKNSLLSYLYQYYNISFKLWFEIGRRSQSGHPLTVPAESSQHHDCFDHIFFTPAGLTATQIKDAKTAVTINRNGNPLDLSLPVVIAAPAVGLNLSGQARTVLANAALRAGTALISGGQPFVPAEIKELDKFIYTWSGFDKDEVMLPYAAMVEIRVSQNPPTPVEFPILNAPEGTPRIFLINNRKALNSILSHIKSESGGLPVAARLTASTHLEKDLEMLISLGVDTIILEGNNNSSVMAPEILTSHFQFPLLPALAQAKSLLRRNHMEDKIDLLASGGLWTSADFLKVIALGANAVLITSAALMAMLQSQMSKAVPWSPLESLFLQGGKKAGKLDIETATRNLVNFLEASRQEMSLAVSAMGKTDITDLTPSNLITLDPIISEYTGAGMPFRSKV